MNKSNDNITFKGKKIQVEGKVLEEGSQVPDFKLTGGDLGDIDQNSYKGKTMIISVVPSVDTGVCSTMTKRLNDEVSKLGDVVLLTVSRDLPFAQARWCRANEAKVVKMGSDYKYRSFGKAFGVDIPELGLLARAVFVVGKDGKIRHTEYVPEIASEPNYDAAISAARAA